MKVKTIVRSIHDPKTPYTIISNACFQSGLSLKAIGLLTYMLSKPDDWLFSRDSLVYQLNEGRDSLDSALKELKAKGHIIRKRHRDKKGFFTKFAIEVHEISIALQVDDPLTGNPAVDFPAEANPTEAKPALDNPAEGNPPLLNTNIPSNNIPNTDLTKYEHTKVVPSELLLVAHAPRVGFQEEISSKEKIQEPKASLEKPKPLKKPKINLSHLETQFEEWYRIYPRRDGRANAFKAFLKALQKISFEKLMECTRAYAKLVESREREKICMPASWLNGERWTDESLSSQVSNLQASKSPQAIHPEFDPLLKICNWIAPSYLGFSWLEREGDCLFVNSDLSFVSDQLKQFDDYFQKAYETTNVYFRHKPKGESVCNQN